MHDQLATQQSPPLGSWPTYSAFRGIAPNEKIMKGGRPPSRRTKNEEEEHPGTGGKGESDARFPNRCVRLKLLRLWFPFPGAEHSFSRLNWTRAKLKVHSWQQAGKEEMQQNTCVEERCFFYFGEMFSWCTSFPISSR